ncbi:MAG: proline--tRNA ligase [Muricomes sp.]
MFYISEIFRTMEAPSQFTTEVQKEVYKTLAQLKIPFERVDTDEAISMEDCVLINEKLNTGNG